MKCMWLTSLSLPHSSSPRPRMTHRAQVCWRWSPRSPCSVDGHSYTWIRQMAGGSLTLRVVKNASLSLVRSCPTARRSVFPLISAHLPSYFLISLSPLFSSPNGCPLCHWKKQNITNEVHYHCRASITSRMKYIIIAWPLWHQEWSTLSLQGLYDIKGFQVLRNSRLIVNTEAFHSVDTLHSNRGLRTAEIQRIESIAQMYCYCATVLKWQLKQLMWWLRGCLLCLSTFTTYMFYKTMKQSWCWLYYIDFTTLLPTLLLHDR